MKGDALLCLTSYQTSLLVDLASADVRYLMIGAMAMQAHGMTRETWDLDLWVARDPENANRLYSVLRNHRSNSPDLSPTWLTLPSKLIELPEHPYLEHEADVLTSIGALDFDTAYGGAVRAGYESLDLSVASIADLINIKRISLAANQDVDRKLLDRRDLRRLEAALCRLRSSA